MLHSERAFAALTLPQVPTLIDPWMTPESVTLVFGPPSAGKTLWATTVARALVRGATLFGTFPCAQSRVLIVQADMPTVMYQERVRASAADTSDDILLWLTENTPLDVLQLATKHRNTVAKVRDFAPAVVFIDTLRKTHHLDENDSAAPDRVYSAWRTLFPKAALLFLHHARKVPPQPGVPDAALREAFRGSSAWAASADTLIAIRRIRRKASKTWLLQQRFVRTRACEEPPALLLRLTPELLLEPTVETLEMRLLAWVGEHADATRADAIAWLQGLSNEHGAPLCAQRRAYRLYDRVVSGTP